MIKQIACYFLAVAVIDVEGGFLVHEQWIMCKEKCFWVAYLYHRFVITCFQSSCSICNINSTTAYTALR